MSDITRGGDTFHQKTPLPKKFTDFPPFLSTSFDFLRSTTNAVNDKILIIEDESELTDNKR